MKPIAIKTSRGWLAMYTDGLDTFPVVDEKYEMGLPDAQDRFGVPTVICNDEETALQTAEQYIKKL